MSQLDQHLTTEQLSASLDDQLTPDEQAKFQTHLKSCTQCQQELTELGQTVALLHALPQPVLPRTFTLPESIPQDQPAPVEFTVRRRQGGKQVCKVSTTLRCLSSLVAVIGIFFVMSGLLNTIPFVQTTGTSGPAVTHPQTGLDPNSRLVTPEVTGTSNGHITAPKNNMQPGGAVPPSTPPVIQPAKHPNTQQVQPQQLPTLPFFDLNNPSERLALGLLLFILGCCGFMYVKRKRAGPNAT